MTKRLQVTITDPEYRKVRRSAQARRISVTEWVRQVLQLACGRHPTNSVKKKLQAIRIAVQHEFPVGDMDRMLREIEAGYGDDVQARSDKQ